MRVEKNNDAAYTSYHPSSGFDEMGQNKDCG